MSDQRPLTKADYGSGVEGRDIPAPVPPVAAHDGPSAPRSGDPVGDASREGSDAPRWRQEPLLPHVTPSNPTGSIGQCDRRDMHEAHEYQAEFGAYFNVYCPGNEGTKP